jgi:hypothetical protein
LLIAALAALEQFNPRGGGGGGGGGGGFASEEDRQVQEALAASQMHVCRLILLPKLAAIGRSNHRTTSTLGWKKTEPPE